MKYLFILIILISCSERPKKTGYVYDCEVVFYNGDVDTIKVYDVFVPSLDDKGNLRGGNIRATHVRSFSVVSKIKLN